MDWFEQLMGFREAGYAETRARIAVADGRLRSRETGRSYAVGTLTLPSLGELRARAVAGPALPGRLRVQVAQGDVRAMHRLPQNQGAMFQVASQFNMLEMTGPSVTPEDGVARYAQDPTQGPACAIAAGAATVYRNYFASVDGGEGQTATRQLDGLADMGAALAAATGLPVDALWEMRNGYALATRAGLDAIAQHLATLAEAQRDALRATLRIGLHSDVEATEAATPTLVSQAFCSALPVAYGRHAAALWAPFAILVLEAAYEATLWAAVLNAQRGASNLVFLTLLGGGAFGNDATWILAAMQRALALVAGRELDVRLVSYGAPDAALLALAAAFD